MHIQPFKPVPEFKQKKKGLNDQYHVKYVHTVNKNGYNVNLEDVEIFEVDNNRNCHKHVERFSKDYLEKYKHLQNVVIKSVTYA